MIILDHNITKDQRLLLSARRVHFKQIGYEVGRPEWDDYQEILRYLHQVNQATFFTRDDDFFKKRLCHPNYCLVFIETPLLETAAYIRKLLRHSKFKTKALRCGKVIRVTQALIAWYEVGLKFQQHIAW